MAHDQYLRRGLTKQMQTSVNAVTGALKDGLRVQLARQMQGMRDGFFHIKSLQDQKQGRKPFLNHPPAHL
jgi:hypothetical protein